MFRDITSNEASPGAQAPRGRMLISVIGIDQYTQWPKLANAVSDASGVLEVFKGLGFVEAAPPLLDQAATREALWHLVSDDLAKLSPDDSLILFFAGHGHTRIIYPDTRPTKIGYVVPVDAELASDRAATMIRLDFWLNEIALLPPRHILVFIDACHSGVALDSVIKWRGANLSSLAIDKLQSRRSRRIVTSAMDDQLAMDGGPHAGHSLFTGCLIEALTTGLVARGHDVVTGSQIGLYVQERVSSYPKSAQTPDFGAMDLDQRGEFVVRLLASAVTPAVSGLARGDSDRPASTLSLATATTSTPVTSTTTRAPRTVRRIASAGAIFVLAGAMLIGVALTRGTRGGMSPAQSTAMGAAVAQLDDDIKAARAAVHERAITSLSIPMVRAAIVTDAATVADAVSVGELQFLTAAKSDTAKGDIVELGRTVKGTNAVEVLLLVPPGSMRMSHDGAAGSYVELVGDQIAITEVAAVVPALAADQARLAGFLSVTRPLPLAPAIKPLIEAGITGKLVINGKSAAIGAMPADATTREQPLGSQDGAKLVAAEPPPRAVMPLPILVGGVGASVIGLLLLLFAGAAGLASVRPRT